MKDVPGLLVLHTVQNNLEADQDSNHAKGKIFSKQMKLSCYKPIWRKKVHGYNNFPIRNNDYLSSLDEMKIAEIKVLSRRQVSFNLKFSSVIIKVWEVRTITTD